VSQVSSSKKHRKLITKQHMNCSLKHLSTSPAPTLCIISTT